jgi:RNA polymerase sigma-70 factor (ECF subfamily)
MTKGIQELLADLQAGRCVRQAQEELYRLVSATLLEPLRRNVPQRARSRLDADDVLQEAFLRVLQNVTGAHCGTERQFLAWVYRIARNLMADQAKRMSARAVPFARGSATGDEARREGAATPRASRIPGRQRSPESTIERKEIIEKVLCQMPEPEADVIRRRWLGGQSFAEIAAALDRTHKAVRGLYTRAWKRFQDLARRGQE